jgi:hypothetical protein
VTIYAAEMRHREANRPRSAVENEVASYAALAA